MQYINLINIKLISFSLIKLHIKLDKNDNLRIHYLMIEKNKLSTEIHFKISYKFA